MHELLLIAVAGLLVVAGCSVLGERFRIATPLLLLAVGVAVSLLPFTPSFSVSPEWILAGILPPLLYSASVSMPVMDFRREFGTISGLSVALVVISAVLVGLLFWWLIPGMTLPWGIALGAIVSPTDAVATGIVKRVGVSQRVVSILEGESLLNDATALVLLRSAVAAAAASLSFWSVIGQFVFAVVVAVAIGLAVGWLNLMVRSRVTDATVNTVLSFTVPFVASIPAEAAGASGLVAAVVAGLVTGAGGVQLLSPQHRLSDTQNWRMIELVLEGAIFLVMGLELSTVLDAVGRDRAGSVLPLIVGVAAAALGGTVLIRAGYVSVLLYGVHRRKLRHTRARGRVEAMKERLENAEDEDDLMRTVVADETARLEAEEDERRRRLGTWRLRRIRKHAERTAVRRAAEPPPGPGARSRLERLRLRLRRFSADIDYFETESLGWREGTVVVWAGMRGAVTLAAAQTLPGDTPDRALLVLIAFVVAAASLVLQGGSLAAMVARVRPAAADPDEEAAERGRLLAVLTEAAGAVPPPADEHDPARVGAHRLAVIRAQRDALLEARREGTFSSGALTSALAVLDADQIGLELRGGREGMVEEAGSGDGGA